MDYAAPQLRHSTANILTDLGWLAGISHVPMRRSLMDFLGRLPFVGIRRDAMLVIEPTRADDSRVTGIAEWDGKPA